MCSKYYGREGDDVGIIGFCLEDGGSRVLGNGYICLHPWIWLPV